MSQVCSHSAKGSGGHSGEFKLHLVDIAPAPVFSWLGRSHDRVLRRVKMFRRVLVLRGIAAADVTAGQTEAQVNPLVAAFQAFFTSFGMRFYVSNLARVRASFHGVSTLSSSERSQGCRSSIKFSVRGADQNDMAAVIHTAHDLVSLVYVSSATREFQSPELLEILRTARKNNQGLDVTGMLLYKDGNFMQVLEGPGNAVTELMCSIERDGRHRGMIVLIKKPIEERQFAKWSMAFKDLNELSPDDKAGHSAFLDGSLLDQDFQTKPDRCYKLMLHFKKNIR